MTPPRSTSRPRAFRLDDPGIVVVGGGEIASPKPRQDQPPEQPAVAEQRSAAAAVDPSAVMRSADVVVEAQPDAFEPVAEGALGRAEAATEVAQGTGVARRSGWTWAGVFWSALGSLVSLALGLWATSLIEGLFRRSAALGWVGLTIAAVAAGALAVLLVREIVGVARQVRIARLHAALASAHAADDRDAARRLVGQLSALYADRPATARARAELAVLSGEIVDGRDLIDIAERSLMGPLDEQVRREIAGAAKRVSVVTALNPRAILDVLFVAGQAVHLIRKTATVYGGRPGLWGFVKLLRSVVTHLVITGGMAVGDSVLQQIVGHGIAARISARLGEGVLNGVLTARIGLSAMAVCRPMPFAAEKPPGVADVAPFLFAKGKQA